MEELRECGVTMTLDTERVICAVDDLAELPCKGFRIGAGPWPLNGFVVRHGNDIHAYLNKCPHAGHPLNLRPDAFLTPDRSMLVCSSHGALFELATGFCVDGPCGGESLARIPLEILHGYVLLAEGVNAADFE